MLLLGISLIFAGCLIIKRMTYLTRQPDHEEPLKYDGMLPTGIMVVVLGMIALQPVFDRLLPIVGIVAATGILVACLNLWDRPVKEMLKGKVARQLRVRFPCASEADINNAIHKAEPGNEYVKPASPPQVPGGGMCKFCGEGERRPAQCSNGSMGLRWEKMYKCGSCGSIVCGMCAVTDTYRGPHRGYKDPWEGGWYCPTRKCRRER